MATEFNMSDKKYLNKNFDYSKAIIKDILSQVFLKNNFIEMALSLDEDLLIEPNDVCYQKMKIYPKDIEQCNDGIYNTKLMWFSESGKAWGKIRMLFLLDKKGKIIGKGIPYTDIDIPYLYITDIGGTIYFEKNSFKINANDMYSLFK